MSQEQKTYSITETPLASMVVAAAISFPELLMSATVAKRIAALIAGSGVDDEHIAELAGLGQRPVGGYRMQLKECRAVEEAQALLAIKKREKTQSKTQGLEA